MKARRLTLAIAVMAATGVAGELLAQENTLPPIDAQSPNLEGHPRSIGIATDQDLCFFNWRAIRDWGVTSNTVIGGQVQEMEAGRPLVCSPTYGVTGANIAGPWAYMFADGQANVGRAPWIPPEQVKEARRRSFEAAGGDPTAPVGPVMPRDDRYRLERAAADHEPVPTIDGELKGQTLRLRVAPGSQGPPTYRGIPVLEPGRSWVRAELPDGKKIWREVRPLRAGYVDGEVRGQNAYRAGGRAYNPIEQSREAYRSKPMRSLGSSMNTGSSSTAAPAPARAPIPIESGTAKSPRSGKVEQ